MVLFGDTPAASFTVSSYGQITAVAPAGSGAQKVSVVNEGGKATSAQSLTYEAAASPPPPPAAAPAPPPPPAGTPARRRGRLSAAVRPARDLRAPFRFRIAGRLTLPSGMSRAVGCSGRVTIQVKRGRVTLRPTRRVSLRRDCSYGVRVSFANRRQFRTAKRLTFTVRFLGNSRVLPAAAARRYGRVRR